MAEEKTIPGVGRRIGFFESPGNLVFVGTCAFLLGVFFANLGWKFYAALASAILFQALVWLFKTPPRRYFILTFSAFLFGFFYFHFYINLHKVTENIPVGQTIEFSGVIVGEPKIFGDIQSFLLRTESPLAGMMKIFVRPLQEFRYGDRLVLKGDIKESELDRSKISFYPEIVSQEPGHGFWLKEKLLATKGLFIGEFRQILPLDSAAFLSGITFGYQSDFTDEFKEKMRQSGTTHLVALSGYNIAIVTLVVSATLGYFFSRRITFFLTTALIFLFVLMVGAEASVVRAAIMGFLALLARDLGKIYSIRNPITIAAAGMTLLDPTILVLNIGFQLSFVSLLGIVYLEPAIKDVLSRKRSVDLKTKSFLGWRENALTTLSAQLAVMPLIIQYFGAISLTALIANVLILGLIPLAMALGFSLALLAVILPYLAVLLSWFLNIILTYEIAVISLFSQIRVPISGSISWIFLVSYYSALIGFTIYIKKKQDLSFSYGKI